MADEDAGRALLLGDAVKKNDQLHEMEKAGTSTPGAAATAAHRSVPAPKFTSSNENGGVVTTDLDTDRMALIGGDSENNKNAPTVSGGGGGGAGGGGGGGGQQQPAFSFDELEFDGLDMTSEEVDFGELEDLMENFQDDVRVKEALEKGIDMRAYSKQVESELRVIERESIQDYIQESMNVATLHKQIVACDSILERMESMLGGFQADLGNISDEIKYLQDKSSSMSVKLKNRKDVGRQLSTYLEELVLPAHIVKQICEEDVNEAYLEYLTELNKRVEFFDLQTTKAKRDVPQSCQDIEPELERLRLKAVYKIRIFLFTKINLLRKPKTNVQILQNTLVRFKYLNVFLSRHDEYVADEVKTQYADTMSRISQTYCKDYIYNLMSLHSPISTRYDLLGAPENSMKSGFFSLRFAETRGNVFSLGGRDSVLREIDHPPLVPHEARERSKTFPYECLFRSMNRYLMDAITAEYEFDHDFFRDASIAKTIFEESSIPFFKDNLANYVSNSFDAIGLLLMVRMTHHFQYVMRRRGSSKSRRLRRKRREQQQQKQQQQRRDGGARKRDVAPRKAAATSRQEPTTTTRTTVDTIAATGEGNGDGDKNEEQEEGIAEEKRGGGEAEGEGDETEGDDDAADGFSLLEQYFPWLMSQLWPRLSFVLTLHTDSVKDANVQTLETEKIDTRPHFVTRRYSELAASLLSLDSDAGLAKLAGHLDGMRLAMESLLVRLSKSDHLNHAGQANRQAIPKGSKSTMESAEMKRVVFLINNYDQILTVLKSREIVRDETRRFQLLLTMETEKFVTMELDTHFGNLLRFVKQNKGAKVERAAVDSIVDEFSSTWKKSVDTLNNEVLFYFSNFKAGSAILQTTCVRLISHYRILEDLIKANFDSFVAFPSFVPTTTLKYHIDKMVKVRW
eukprot:TRINITY_DN279_c1_g4_i1.p1 TRINITY_DN279_c1_g4~~TRINITY_DN279_c1_g4_i1.p1  ORF type:complete len:919 (-),score=301.86 TRINITY_DN279_c1_g4_i1:59-2785(-)